jgi:SPP1 gp7 family putative phage head morphogenesis protein
MPKTLLKSSRYSKFVAERNRALEQIHVNAQTDLSRITYAMLSQVENLTSAAALKAKTAYMTHQVSVQFENGLRDIMTQMFPIFVRRMFRLRRSAFILAYAGEQEAIGRATQRRGDVARSNFAARLKDEASTPTLLGALDKRIWLALMNLRRDVVKAFELGMTQELKPDEIVQKVKDVFPKTNDYKRAPAALTKTREADYGGPKKKKDWFDFGFIDDADWDMAVNAYLDTEIPESRFDYGLAEGETRRYNWELEQEATEDFVRSVRSGQVAGAEDLGVKEFVWIAVIDSKTCDECCLPRSGKTTSEIEKLDDDCDATVPPAHFNCRCDIGPVASADEVSGPDWSDFKEWLESA